MMARRPDPHIAERMRAEAFFRRQERKLFAGVITAMTAWLDDARTLILGDDYLPPALTAAADQPDFAAVNASFETWRRGLQRHIEPVIEETFGEAFAAHSRAADISAVHWQEHHMATVHDRLKIWPENAFEELRPELLEAMVQNEDIDQIQDRIGRTLNIDAPSRRIRANISAIDAKLADPETPPADIAGLKGRRRTLWNQHDESLLDWQWKARRIARTEIQGAINAGTWASAEATAQITGEKLHKAWLATSDERTRVEHVVADGQIVPISTSFSVAGYPMMYPADPFAPGHLTINCLVDPSTPIATERGEKAVSDIRVGDRVVTHTGAVGRVSRLAVPRTYSGDVVCIEVNGNVLRLTPNHPVLTTEGWVIAGELGAGRIVLCASPVELGHVVVDSGLLDMDSRSLLPAATARAEGPVAQDLSLTVLHDEVVGEVGAQLNSVPADDLPSQHDGPVLVGSLLVLVDDPISGDLTQKSNEPFVAVGHDHTGLVMELAGGVTTGTAASESDDAFPVDHGGEVSSGNRFHRAIVPQPVVRYWIENAVDVQLFNFAVDGDESYVAAGIAVHNCRCTMRILTPDEVQDELQGMWGGRGVGPGNARLGPDMNDDVTRAIEKWKAEQRGEVVEDNRTPEQIERDARREAPDRLNPGWSEQDAVRPHENPPVTVVDPEPDDAPIIINIGGDDQLPDDESTDNSELIVDDLPDDDPEPDDEEEFGPLEPTTTDGTDEVTDGLARRDVQDFPEHLRERLEENGVTVEIADTILDAPAGEFLADDEVDDGRPWGTVGGVYLNFGDGGGVVVLSGVEHGSENMAFHELAHAVDDRYLHNRPLNVEWREQGARHLPESIRPAVQRPYRQRITRVTDDPYLEWAHKIVYAEDRADDYYVRGSLGNERSGRDEWFAESLAAFLLGATAKMLEVSGGNRIVVDVLKWTFRRILKL